MSLLWHIQCSTVSVFQGLSKPNGEIFGGTSAPAHLHIKQFKIKRFVSWHALSHLIFLILVINIYTNSHKGKFTVLARKVKTQPESEIIIIIFLDSMHSYLQRQTASPSVVIETKYKVRNLASDTSYNSRPNVAIATQAH